MSAIKLVIDIGLQAIPGVGKALDAGLGMFPFTFYVLSSALHTPIHNQLPSPEFSWSISYLPFILVSGGLASNICPTRRGNHGGSTTRIRIPRRRRPGWSLRMVAKSLRW